GVSGIDSITKDGALSITGTEAGATIEYSTDGGQTWSSSFTPVEGSNTVSVRQTDVAGNTSGATTVSFVLDTQVAAPTVSLTSDTGVSGSDNITNSGALTIGGTETGATIEYSIDGGQTWSSSFTPVEGSNTVAVRQTDVAGNTSAATTVSFVLDTQVAAPTVSLTNDTGASGSDSITNSGALTVGGVETGATVEYSIDGGQTWTDSFSAVEGSNTVSVRQTDVAGNTSGATTLSFVLDTSAPNLTVSIDPITADNTVNAAERAGDTVTVTGKVTGEVAVDDAVVLTVGSSQYAGTVIDLGNGELGFSINVGSGDLADNISITASVTHTDAAGNTGSAEADRAYAVDTSATAAPTVTISTDANNDGVLNNTELGNAATISITIGLPSGAIVGDMLNVNLNGVAQAAIQLTEAQIAAGSVVLQTARAADGDTITASATLTDAARNTSDKGSDSAVIGNNAPQVTVTASDVTEQNVSTDTVIATFTASDADNDSLTFSLLNNANGYFVIDGNTVKLTQAGVAAINDDTLNLQDLTISVEASDGTRTGSDSDVSTITRVNDNAPQVTVTASPVTEESVTVGQTIATFTASDADNDSLTFSLLNNANGYFVIDGNTVKLTQAGVEAINDDTLNLQNLTISVEASDGTRTGSDSDVSTITRVNDNAPQVTVTASPVTEESVTVGQTIATFTASDADNDSLTFSLLNNDNGYFVIDGNTVKLTQAGVAAINDDTLNLQDLTISVEASDGTRTGSDSDVSTITRVNDNAPQVTVTASDVTEQNVSTDTVIATFTASDADNDSLTFSLLNNANGYFVIDGNTVKLTQAGVAAINDDTLNLQNLTISVEASDGTRTGSDSDVSTITRVNDNAPQVTVTASPVTEESVTVGQTIATFTASDADNDSLTFSLLNNDNGYFVIDGNTVKLTQAGVAAINDDTLNLQDLTISVEASDGTRTGSDSDVSTITRVNDNAPQVTDASVSLDENVAANTAVINVSDSFTNTDLDRDGDAITYSITGGNSAGIFVIDAATGAITIAAGKTLDYETANEHVLTVTASDGALFDTANITVNVNNLPDTPPVVTASSALVSETGLKSATDTDTSNVASGKIAITHDAATVVTLIPPTTTGLKSGGTDITWSLSSDGKTLTGNAGTDKAIAITIDNQGNYSVSLLKPIDHPDTASADVLNLSVGVKVTDAYNNQSTNALTVQIQDDVPTASPGGVTISIPVSSINVSGLEAGFVNPTSTGGGTSGLTQANTDSDSYIDKINWGGSSGSGYTFTDNETYRTSGPSLPNSDFKVGTLTHNNFPVSSNDSVLSTVGLRVKLTVMIDGVPTMIEHTVNLRHTETPNNYNTQDPVNDDIIRLDNSTLVKQFTVGGRTFEFEIKGFLDPQTGDVVTTIYTTENAASAFDLYAVVKSTDGLPLNSGDVSANAATGADGSVAATGSNAVIEWTGATINSDGSSTISNDFGTFTGWPDGRYRFEVSRTARDDFNADQVENLKFGYVVIDGDGDRASSEVTVTLNGEKVVPYAPVVNQDAQTTVLSGDAGTESTASLGIDAGRDIEGASIKFTATDDASLNGQPVKGNVLFSGASESVALTSGGMALVYRANADGSLDAVKQGTNDVVFKVTGDVAKGTYSVEMVGTLDQATKFSSNTANLSFFQQNGLAQASTGTADLSVSLSGTGGTPYWSGDRLGIDAPGTSSGNENREFNYRSNSETLKINFAVIEGISVSSVELGTRSFNDGEQLQYRINGGAWQTIESNTWSPNVTINSNNAISTLELRAGNEGSEFSIDSARVSYTKIIAADDSSNITLSLGATVTDGSGDKASTDFNVVIDPDHSLQGTTGNDSLMGSDLADTLRGESGDDQLNGGTGNDLLVGGAGDDILIGGLGDDQLTGGSGADTFTWKAGDLGKDSILDFNASEGDRIDLSDLLQGENDGNLLSYLRVDTTTSTLQISTTGVLNDSGSNADVTIKLENGGAAVDLSSYSSNPTDIINSLVAEHIVKVDH
ncbi:Ig-like domain-containing protein, partial [Pseudomonas balearica]